MVLVIFSHHDNFLFCLDIFFFKSGWIYLFLLYFLLFFFIGALMLSHWYEKNHRELHEKNKLGWVFLYSRFF